MTDPLPSWNDGSAKQAIVSFIKETTTKGGSKFVAPEERIAAFDQDGTSMGRAAGVHASSVCIPSTWRLGGEGSSIEPSGVGRSDRDAQSLPHFFLPMQSVAVVSKFF